MSQHQAIVTAAGAVLHRLGRDKPWMTARGLARRLGGRFDEEAIRTALVKESQRDERVIRYAYYPSRRTLDTLWGHVRVVGNRGVPPLERTDAPADFLLETQISAEEGETLDEDEDTGFAETTRPRLFLSHNNRDAEKVFALRDALKERFDCWAFQTAIEEHADISASVRLGLAGSAHFIAYVSPNSLGSLWVAKEWESSGGTPERLKKAVFIDGADPPDGGEPALRTFFETWPGPAGWDAHINSVVARLAHGIPVRRRDVWCQRAKEFLSGLSFHLDETPRLYAHPAPTRPWQGRELELGTVEDYLAATRDGAGAV